jgi:hypothetical protein
MKLWLRRSSNYFGNETWRARCRCRNGGRRRIEELT